jgi:predicted membrane channel-forming protein YqfA (hemolysin III family)
MPILQHCIPHIQLHELQSLPIPSNVNPLPSPPIINARFISIFNFSLDLSGVQLLIFGSSFPFMYYGFQCEPFIRQVYINVTFVCTLCVFVLSFTEFIQKPTNLAIRAAIYMGYAALFLLPYIHLIVNK